MSIPTLTTLTNPNVGLGYNVNPRVKEMGYGDGYVQRTRDGLNTMPRSFSVVWGPISPAEAQAIIDFFEARGGVEPFYWRTPREVEQNLPARKYICKPWGQTEPTAKTSQVNATFTQDFSLGT